MRPAFEAMTITPAADGRTATVSVEAGKRWHALVMELATAGWWGYKNLALIPGCCGAAPIHVLGAYGVELADPSAATGSHVAGGWRHARWLSREESAPSATVTVSSRGRFEHRVLITRLEFVVTREATPQLAYGDLAQHVRAATPQGEAITPLSVANAVIATRSEKLPDPAVLGNAGSFFKNPSACRRRGSRAVGASSDLAALPAGRWQRETGGRLAHRPNVGLRKRLRKKK